MSPLNSRIISTVTVLLLASVFFGACQAPPPKTVRAPSPAPSYGWTLNTNQHETLSNYQGKVVLLDFYATWCGPCRAAAPHLVRLQDQFGSQGFQIIGLNVGGEEDYAKIPAYAKELGIQYRLGIPDDELLDTLMRGNDNIPQAFVFDRKGRIVKRFIGYNESVGLQLEQVVQAALAAGP